MSSDFRTIRFINITVNSVSLLGSLFIICVYLFWRRLRSYPFKLVAYMAVSNLILSLAYMVSAIDLATGGPLCVVQVRSLLTRDS